MRAIFISYRRDDTEGQSGRLYDDLSQHFGKGAVFMDVVGIEPGRDFRKVIDKNVASCGVLLAVIGPTWLDAKDETGIRRLDNPMDFVRLETAAALKRDIPVVPVLVRGAKMPKPDQLPDDLQELAYRNGIELTHARWDSDIEVLIKALRRDVDEVPGGPSNLEVEKTPPVPAPKPVKGHEEPSRESRHLNVKGIVAGIAVAAIAVGLLLYFRGTSSDRNGSSNVQPITDPVIKAFSATPLQIIKGGKVTLRWEVENADDIRLEPFGMVTATGSTTDEPQKTTIYKLTATNRGGGKSGTFQEVIVNESNPVSAENKPKIEPGPKVPSFAGTWELTENTYNGKQRAITKKQLVTITQNGALVHISDTEDRRELRVTPEGTIGYQSFHAHDSQNGHEVKTAAEADLVDTFTWSLDGPTLVFRTVFDYRHQYYQHAPGKDLRVMKYRRVGASSAGE